MGADIPSGGRTSEIHRIHVRNPNLGDPSIKRETEIFLELAATFPPDWPALDWIVAVDRVVRGLGAFHVDGMDIRDSLAEVDNRESL